MDIILKNIKLLRGNIQEKGEPEASIIRTPTMEEQPLILEQIEQLFDNIMSAIEDIGEGYSIDTDEFLRITEPLFFYENEDLFWAITFDSIEIR